MILKAPCPRDIFATDLSQKISLPSKICPSCSPFGRPDSAFRVATLRLGCRTTPTSRWSSKVKRLPLEYAGSPSGTTSTPRENRSSSTNTLNDQVGGRRSTCFGMYVCMTFCVCMYIYVYMYGCLQIESQLAFKGRTALMLEKVSDL